MFSLIFTGLFLSCDSLIAQVAVTGTVTSAEDGSTLPGVNILLKGTSTGTLTDIDGNFKLEVPQEGGVLVFSSIGFT
ncbi:MAG TPA: carboxypeptidase-like regulatory domain-containing protein, partial [Cyclobacteriaceae bacterium]|nr:carboxypeptidase-like regulatory domain-containing protein [Cyclobacteriaceae bacterium]